jgi:hypothetical protein
VFRHVGFFMVKGYIVASSDVLNAVQNDVDTSLQRWEDDGGRARPPATRKPRPSRAREIAIMAHPSRRLSDTDPRQTMAPTASGWWVVDRLNCWWRGHRNLSRTPSYAAALSDGRIQELQFCLSCDTLVWTIRQPTSQEISPTWSDLQI